MQKSFLSKLKCSYSSAYEWGLFATSMAGELKTQINDNEGCMRGNNT